MPAQSSNKKIILIAGPTASGKTATAVKAGKKLRAPVVSADSRQVFHEMQIGSARPLPEELEDVPHFLLGHRSVLSPYSAHDFAEEARSTLAKLFESEDTVIMCGGSGLYIRAALEGLDDIPDTDPAVRENLRLFYENEGIKALQNLLKEQDPDYYDTADIHNPQRVIRALEVSLSTGKPFSSFHQAKADPLPWPVIKTGIDLPRDVLYNRINQRVDLMIREGLVEEAKKLYPQRGLASLNTVGYKELFEWMDGEYDLDTAIGKIKQHTRNFAKRQMTWFRKMDIQWFSDPEKLIEFISTK